jgi:hypothetical protein
MNWDMISFLFRALGFILIAVGALVLVVAGQFSGSCYATTSTCTSVASTTISGLANAYIAGEAVIILGALLLGLGAGIKLHWVLRAPSGGSSEQFAWVLMERIFNYAVLAVSLVILTWTVWTMPILWALIRGAAH